MIFLSLQEKQKQNQDYLQMCRNIGELQNQIKDLQKQTSPYLSNLAKQLQDKVDQLNKQVEDKDKANQVACGTDPLLTGGAAGLCLIIVLISIIWFKRKTHTVKKSIYNRQIKSTN